ncbi:hypothetical protein AB0L65_17700 [Nonomuraea sp. NPDC052116]|uniref:hypothetical protein n=1 Tax=Nonomuraea sp. NPDC052116 TaxID=3155665 RepID=UPI00343EF70A
MNPSTEPSSSPAAIAADDHGGDQVRMLQRGVDRERAELRRIGGDLTDAEVTACLRVLSRLLGHLDDIDMD